MKHTIASIVDRQIKMFYAIYFADYVFIHINKTGGTSIKKALYLPQNHHATAIDFKKEIGDKRWGKRFKFTFVRNPWDKIVSQYHYQLQRTQKYKNYSFAQWIEEKYVEKKIPLKYKILYIPQVKWITDKDGKIMVDFIGKFENIEEDFSKICKIIGKKRGLPHLKKTKHKSYREYYNEETKEVIRNHFKRDIEMFGYKF